MKKTICSLAIAATLFSCSKGGGSDTAPAVDNGPLGGTYSFTTSTIKSYDTVNLTGVVTTHEYNSTSSGVAGTLTITAGTIASKGLLCNFTTTGVTKETNTGTGTVITTNYGPVVEPKGTSASAYSSNYSFSIAGSEMSVTDAQYLFCPAFVTLPASQKYSYTYAGGILKVTVESYTAVSRYRSVCESVFTKQ